MIVSRSVLLDLLNKLGTIARLAKQMSAMLASPPPAALTMFSFLEVLIFTAPHLIIKFNMIIIPCKI